MLLQLQNHLNINFPFLKGKKLLITVSGGVDSIVLASLFNTLECNIGIAHCNFKLRNIDSDKDELFVQNFADNHNIPFHNIQFDTQKYCEQNKVSTQIGARELRYNWFHKLSNEHRYDYILTAHHLNDVMETFFINLSRGTGLDGLTGIPPINKNIIRPLLSFSRKQIEQYALDNNILWREDKSNAETKYLRNKIRHKIVPEFYKLNPQFEENFKTSVRNIYQSKEFIHQKITALKETLFNTENDITSISKTILLALSDFEIYELFKAYGFYNTAEIKKLLSAQSGKEIYAKNYNLLINREHVLLYHKQNKTTDSYTIKSEDDVQKLPIPLFFTSFKRELNQNTIAIDLTQNPFPFILRKLKNGDVFYPTGMMGKKKVSKYFKDQKFSKLEKEATWILCNHQNKIIWIVGYRADRTETANTKQNNLLFIEKK